MPTYLVHGFRWKRTAIIVHIIMQDLEEATAEWLMNTSTQISLLNSFYSLFDFLPPSNPPPITSSSPPPSTPSTSPDREEQRRPRTLTKKNPSTNSLRPSSKTPVKRTLSRSSSMTLNGFNKTNPTPTPSNVPYLDSDGGQMKKSEKEKDIPFNTWSAVKLLEQYDPEDLKTVSMPFAYVADHLIEVRTGVSISEEMSKYETRVRGEEVGPGPAAGPVAVPGIPGTPGMAGVGSMGDLMSPSGGMSARELRRKERRAGWFEKLRDELQKDANIGWFVVVCGDEDRVPPTVPGSIAEEDEESVEAESVDGKLAAEVGDRNWNDNSKGNGNGNGHRATGKGKGFKGMFGKKTGKWPKVFAAGE